MLMPMVFKYTKILCVNCIQPVEKFHTVALQLASSTVKSTDKDTVRLTVRLTVKEILQFNLQ